MMSKRLFGTDGIRGVAGEPPLDAQTVTALGRALGKDLARRQLQSYPVLIGMDTRESGPAIAAQLAGGLAAEGLTAEFLGVITTPGVAWLARTGGYAAGVMVSASHNPFQDNGIKIFDRTGFKLPDAEEHEIEEEIFRQLEIAGGRFAAAPPLPVSSGSIRRYIDFLLSTIDCNLNGLRLVLDCGNGAASPHAPGLFRAAGAEVIALFDQPDGRNINLGCGAVHPEKLREAVIARDADAGIAFDGDADRAILVAASGRIIDGDAVLLIVSRALQSAGLLTGGEVVSTVMSNIGLERALRASGIGMVRTQVGDKYVLEEMLRRGAALGGEQSGHVIFHAYATTGDGMLTGLQTLQVAAKQGKVLDELAADLVVFPQTLVNVRVKERRPLDSLPVTTEAIRASERQLDGAGRVLVRYSGTEPLLRVMVEGTGMRQVEEIAERIAGAIRTELG
jgi:phosphoglucosamine mutase